MGFRSNKSVPDVADVSLPVKPEERHPERSIELINHFRCVKCNKWWSIGDAPKSKTKWWCPWCGKENKYKIKG